MPRPIVVDTSAALAWIRGEPLGDTVASHLERQRAANGEVVVPWHFWLEVANVLVRRYRYEADDVVDTVRNLDAVEIRAVELNRVLWLLMLDRMTTLGLTAYDAAYLALAESIDATLLTLDAGLAAAAGPRTVPIGPRRLAEVPSTYQVAQPGEVWARFGEYLAQLRREVLAG